MWQRIVQKLCMVFLHLEQVTKMKAILGEPIFNNLFGQSKTIYKDRPQMVINRLIDGEVVAEELPPSKGVPDVEPAMCNHPVKDKGGNKNMVKEGNQSDKKSWRCKMCKSRWRRYAVSDYQIAFQKSGQNMKERILMEGKYAGNTFLEIYKMDGPYVQYILMACENDPDLSLELRTFAQWAAQQEREDPMIWEIPTPSLDDELGV